MKVCIEWDEGEYFLTNFKPGEYTFEAYRAPADVEPWRTPVEIEEPIVVAYAAQQAERWMMQRLLSMIADKAEARREAQEARSSLS
jgi:hypothetical protein